MKLTAYSLYPGDFSISPAPARRRWMDDTGQHFANRCLPLLMANQSGWWVTTKEAITATWSGTDSASSLEVTGPALSHFGYGILTITLPFLFRTDLGTDLLVRGPANLPKDGVSPLEGLIETAVLDSSFTVNWKFTRPCTVTWEIGEPVAMLVPTGHNDLESVETEQKPLSSDSDLQRSFQEWSASREEFNARLKAGCPHAAKQGWQKDYYRQALRSKRTLKGFSCSD